MRALTPLGLVTRDTIKQPPGTSSLVFMQCRGKFFKPIYDQTYSSMDQVIVKLSLRPGMDWEITVPDNIGMKGPKV